MTPAYRLNIGEESYIYILYIPDEKHSGFDSEPEITYDRRIYYEAIY